MSAAGQAPDIWGERRTNKEDFAVKKLTLSVSLFVLATGLFAAPVRAEQPRTIEIYDKGSDVAILREEAQRLLKALNAAVKSVEVSADPKKHPLFHKVQSEFDREKADIKARYEGEIKAAREERDRAKAETEKLRAALVAGGPERMVALADAGSEKVFLRGVGEVLIAKDGGRSVMKVEVKDALKVDKALAGKAERIDRNGFAYFIFDARMIAN